MDQQVVDGMKLWLKARQVEAVMIDDKEAFEVICVLLADIDSSAAANEYPWELLMRGLTDRAKNV